MVIITAQDWEVEGKEKTTMSKTKGNVCAKNKKHISINLLNQFEKKNKKK